jgi:ABC-2 type transport system ATP-binding protein
MTMARNQYAIEVKNLSKKFRVFHDRPQTIKERLLFNQNRFTDHVVLQNVGLNLEWGRSLGLVGRNGSGKSTLLKLLTGIIYPDTGTIDIFGKVSSLLELGAGFHPDFSGRENVYNNASIFGLTKKEIAARFDEILDFSELHEFIDNPVRTYSSGMYMRLAFSVAINVEADILLVDEVLSVGDVAFQHKCLDRVRELKAKGKTIVLVSHDAATVREFCDLVFWLDSGDIKMSGSPDVVMREYENVIH